MIGLSARMEALAALVTSGGVLADVGTDHAHLPIALVQREHIPRAIAMDIRRGPLLHAQQNIHRCGLEDRIDTRLSDGVHALSIGEADSILIAGMGGELILHILREGEEICRNGKEIILQPQSQIGDVRHYLRQQGYKIVQEDMVVEDGKYYPMMRVVPNASRECPLRTGSAWRSMECPDREDDLDRSPGCLPREKGPDRSPGCLPREKGLDKSLKRAIRGEQEADSVDRLVGEEECIDELEDRYGPILLRSRHPVLKEYLYRQKSQLEHVLERLDHAGSGDRIRQRIEEVGQELQLCQRALIFCAYYNCS